MTIDPKQYKEELSHGYDNAAPGWQKWWKTIETATQEVSKRLVELAEIKPGSKGSGYCYRYRRTSSHRCKTSR